MKTERNSRHVWWSCVLLPRRCHMCKSSFRSFHLQWLSLSFISHWCSLRVLHLCVLCPPSASTVHSRLYNHNIKESLWRSVMSPSFMCALKAEVPAAVLWLDGERVETTHERDDGTGLYRANCPSFLCQVSLRSNRSGFSHESISERHLQLEMLRDGACFKSSQEE